MKPSPSPSQLTSWRFVSAGLCALCGSASGVSKLAGADHEVELQRNTQLREAKLEVQSEHHANSHARVIQRLSILRGALLKSFASMASAVALAFVLHATGAVIPTPVSVLGISSVFCFAWATLGRLGWGGQSYKGDTAVERLDQHLFHLLYWLGMYFGTAAAL